MPKRDRTLKFKETAKSAARAIGGKVVELPSASYSGMETYSLEARGLELEMIFDGNDDVLVYVGTGGAAGNVKLLCAGQPTEIDGIIHEAINSYEKKLAVRTRQI
jgi:hypothetical protein